ncbi:MAG: hypothetical protein WKF37_15800 [Bryobacteraceae bacterium]
MKRFLVVLVLMSSSAFPQGGDSYPEIPATLVRYFLLALSKPTTFASSTSLSTIWSTPSDRYDELEGMIERNLRRLAPIPGR